GSSSLQPSSRVVPNTFCIPPIGTLACDHATPFSADIVIGSTAAGSTCFLLHTEWEDDMPESVFKVIELIGTSNESWEKAAANAGRITGTCGSSRRAFKSYARYRRQQDAMAYHVRC